ncbi:Franean1_4349 family RiPP [Geobacter hydrogenophilus]|uniref:Nif11 domain-containing protein n=1 Tax=Geobacter hydrogenophilus TaxID=40983 RepID=A0A9W6FYX0_9BACT|nr:Franean1_4349 family RiPP [Geobacter hydrogenophilus]MBT0894716.1 Franean1_4349 family RiPP [Geobacter hydrogenophilus]GLI37446.1 hypothetical protein GHYDROH2_09470 [Geobacter hydrogenophilus]
MSQEGVEKFLGRLLTDDAFRHRAESSPADACRLEGYTLSVEELQAIRGEDFARIDSIARLLDSRIKRFSRA